MRKPDRHYEKDQKVETEIIRIISEITDIEETNITLTSDLVKELGLDSFAAVELQFSLEDFFEIKCSNEEMKQLKTVEDIAKLIHNKLDSKI